MPRARAFSALLLASLAPLGACEPPPPPAPAGPSASATAAAPVTAPKPSEPPPPPAPDLDVAALQKALACPPTPPPKPGAPKVPPKPSACAVLARLESCPPWDPPLTSGDGRWIGRAFFVEQGKTRTAPLVVRLQAVTLREVGAGQVPIKLGTREITKDDGRAFADAEKALVAFERFDVPNRNSEAMDFARTDKLPTPTFMSKTQAGHLYGLSPGGTYACLSGARVAFVERSPTGSAQGDGTYVELFAANW